MRTWPARRWMAAAAVTVIAALVIGVPTGVVPTPFYTRMTPVLWWNYPVWGLSAGLTGLIVATYVRSATAPFGGGRVTAGGVLSAFAVGCPICNKLVVALIGLSGALNYWAPMQPILGLASLALLAFALRSRLRGERACAVRNSDDHSAANVDTTPALP